MIRLENVRKSYDGGQTWAVRGVSLHVRAGEVLVLLGGSGSGKTTTLKTINRLIEPTDGEVWIRDRNVTHVNPVELRRSMGYAIQGTGLFPHMSVSENIAVVPKLLGWPRERILARVDELLAMVHMPPEQYRDRMPDSLSGGQRQRIGFARALAASPGIMLMDEPFGAVDPLTRDTLQQEFMQIQKELSLTVVMVTHDVTEALIMATRIAIMRDGGLCQIGTPEELLRHPGDESVERLISGPLHQARALNELMNHRSEEVSA